MMNQNENLFRAEENARKSVWRLWEETVRPAWEAEVIPKLKEQAEAEWNAQQEAEFKNWAEEEWQNRLFMRQECRDDRVYFPDPSEPWDFTAPEITQWMKEQKQLEKEKVEGLVQAKQQWVPTRDPAVIWALRKKYRVRLESLAEAEFSTFIGRLAAHYCAGDENSDQKL